MKKVLLTVTLAMTIGLGLAQNALNFDGTNDYVQTTFEGVFGEDNRTFEAWVFVSVDAPASNLAITDYGLNAVGSRNTFAVGGSRSLQFLSGGVDANISTGPDVIPEGVWTHVAFVLNSGTGYLYVNGVEMGTGSLTTVDTPTGHLDLRIGQRVPGGSIPFEGSIDEVRIWDVARTEAEILANMNAEFCEEQENLVAYYRFNEGTAGADNTGITDLPDLIDSNDGDLNNFALDGAISNWVDGEDLAPGYSLSSQDVVLCEGESLDVGASTYTVSGEYLDILESVITGCDSILTTNLTVLEEIELLQIITLCDGEVLEVGDSEYDEAGEYTDVLTTDDGCDSTVYTTLSYYGEIEFSQDIVLCAGVGLEVGDSEYTEAGEYTDVLTTDAGCDSTVYTTLSFLDEIEFSQEIILCPGEVLEIGDSEYAEAGEYEDLLTTDEGCDSTVFTSLSYHEEIEFSQDIMLCEGESINVGESTYTEAGEYVDILVSELTGCDSNVISIITIPLIDVTTSLSEITISSNHAGALYQWVDCDNDFLAIDGETDQSFTPSEDGNYAVIVALDGCSDTSECTVISGVGLEAFTASTFSFHPNPVNADLNLIIEDNAAIYTVIIYNIIGEELMYLNGISGTVLIDVETLPKGIYVLALIGEKTYRSAKFLKE